MRKMKSIILKGNKYYFIFIGSILIGNGIGLFLVFNIDSIRDFQISTFNETEMGPSNIEKCSSQYKCQATDYIEHDPIFIDGNDDFITQAASEGWPGDGTEESPFVISGLKITTSEDLIGIRNADLYFQVSNCLLIDGIQGISLNNAENGHIFNNTVYNTIGGNNERWGIFLSQSKNIIISENIVYNCEFAFDIQLATEGNMVSNNSVHDNINPIMISRSNNTITRNNIYDNDMGVSIYNSMYISFTYNTIKNSGWNGVDLQSCDNSFFRQNTIYCLIL